jgi:hypothetical protein
MTNPLAAASDRYHRAVVRKVVNGITSQNGRYEMVKVTFMLFTPGHAGDEVEKYYCIRAASNHASNWAVKDGKAHLAKLYFAASKQPDDNPACLVDCVITIRLTNNSKKSGENWATVADVKAVKPYTQGNKMPKEIC